MAERVVDQVVEKFREHVGSPNEVVAVFGLEGLQSVGYRIACSSLSVAAAFV